MRNRTPAAEYREASRRSAEIDRIIAEDSKRLKGECKVLLLGSSKSGKSTIVKQMKIIHGGGLSTQERIAYRTTIYRNLLESARALTSAIYKLSMEPVDTQNRETAEQIAHSELNLFSLNSNFHFPEHLALSINRLWRDPVTTKIMDYHSDEVNLMDSASYFFAEAERIGRADYIPNETDILKCWEKSTRIVETAFDMPPLSIRIIDFRGQHFARRKWIHYFDDVTSVMFCIALSEYDQVIYGQNRLEESIELFSSITKSTFFSRASILLFMNKIDVFREKVPRVPLERYFPEYTGGPNVNKAAKYILWRFMQTNQERRSVYPHLTHSNDPTSLRLVFQAVKETIFQNTLRDSLKEPGIL